jgi:hypothetical protein
MISKSNVLPNAPEIIDYFTEFMKSSKPMFISRIGGSDFELVCDYYNNNEVINDDSWYLRAVRRVKELNGYFNFNNDKACFKQFLDSMISYYESGDLIGYAGKQEKYFRFMLRGKSELDSRFEPLISHISTDKILFNWNEFIQPVTPFLQSFKTWGENKTILIVSPFSKSIEYQYSRKDKLFLNYQYPEFKLKTYNTNITYNDSSDSADNLNITTENWHDECKRMADEIKHIDFDIAFLSCGSYAMFLGHYIKNEMGKQALYLGGSLNLYFNIYGKRFEPLYDKVGLNPEYQIDAFENTVIENISGGRSYTNESLDAYFGKKPT